MGHFEKNVGHANVSGESHAASVFETPVLNYESFKAVKKGHAVMSCCNKYFLSICSGI